MTTATFGDLLGAAATHLAAAAQRAYRETDLGHLVPAISATARVADALQWHLAAVIDDSGIQPYMSTGSSGVYLAIHAREALRTAAGHLATAGQAIKPYLSAPEPDRLTPDIATAARHLLAGHDLLRTHFTGDSDGLSVPASRWSAVVTSPAVTTALLKEISRQAQQLWRLTVGLSYAVTGNGARYGIGPAELDHANRWLRHAQVLLNQTASEGQAVFPGRVLLHAIPANQVPDPVPLTAPESLAGLCQGITVSAERLHANAFIAPHHAAWPPVHTAESWRWTATARAVTADITEILLRSLAERVQALPADPFARRLLTAAAEAAANVCERWRHVTAAWGQMTTDTKGLTAPGITDSSDLLIRLGRLAFDNQHWTPARERQAGIRDPADLAAGPDQVVAVFAAVHQASDTLAAIAVADEQDVRAAISARRLYLPTRLLSDKEDIPRPYGPARTIDTQVLLKTYTSAAAASTELAVALDAAALALDTPSRIIAAARIATRPGQETVRAGQSPQLNPAWPQLPAPEYQPRGPVEQRLRQLKIDDDILLLRAKAIDTAGRHLITEARAEASQPEATRQATQATRSKASNPGRSPVAQNFPVDPTSRTAGRPATDASRPSGRTPLRPPTQQRR